MHCDMVDISTRGNYDNSSFYKPFYRINLEDSYYMEEPSNKKKPSYVPKYTDH